MSSDPLPLYLIKQISITCIPLEWLKSGEEFSNATVVEVWTNEIECRDSPRQELRQNAENEIEHIQKGGDKKVRGDVLCHPACFAVETSSTQVQMGTYAGADGNLIAVNERCKWELHTMQSRLQRLSEYGILTFRGWGWQPMGMEDGMHGIQAVESPAWVAVAQLGAASRKLNPTWRWAARLGSWKCYEVWNLRCGLR